MNISGFSSSQPVITGPVEYNEASRPGDASSRGPRTSNAPVGPEGLQSRRAPAPAGGNAPRQKLPPKGDAPKPDGDTLSVIAQQEQQSINSNALAMATAKASGIQAMNEFIKSMSEAEAKNVKSAGESLKNLS
jgi:hypothetical protein